MSTDSAVLHSQFNQIIQDYLVTNSISDFTKYDFYIGQNLKPLFYKWEYSIDKPIFKKHDTHIKIRNLENRIAILEKQVSSLTTSLSQLKSEYYTNLSSQQSNTLTTLKEVSANLSKVEHSTKSKSLTLPKASILTRNMPSSSLTQSK